ncbi:hypothetical protein AC52_2470 [Escherichia coli 5-366-08_S3_C3]|nr:hypothetical protein AC52_2470 [Escherichia coli 5-366-08_S3_C3]KEL89099.1 hypothetical protein AB94_4482 [Escherichia coli 5-366-08_S3_C1]QAZ72501.1 Mobile element protein [Escherichia coli]
MRHRLSLLAQQVPVVQAGVRIVNQNARKKQNPPKRVFCTYRIMVLIQLFLLY